ncbi:hypothetical protein K8089_04425 [Aequorivita sp. F47161]|uniref:Uncharacterized protein n=1 Tax=Aequorivita vitellina TaxID=2874475 RepID=A0A9X1QW75_9FLAO|nr:hypothetical protein [Aequorivita vitellina]MCG2418258.1 hypothetical protein [Aequorivita vitellina]
MNKESLAITKNCKDFIRIKPFGSKLDKTDIKFSFLCPSFQIRNFEENKEDGILRYVPKASGIAEHEISYHNSNEINLSPVLLPKYKSSESLRIPISSEIIDLNLKNLLVPIPICRITINQDSTKTYKEKEKHQVINLTPKYNTTEIYISSAKYDLQEMRNRFPLIVGDLFTMTTIDFLIYGAGLASESNFKKMFENDAPSIAFESNLIGNYRFYYRTYEVERMDKFRLTSNKIYSSKNVIDFFNNIDYLNILGTTAVSYRSINKGKPKPAYKWDLEHLEKIKFYNSYIKKWRTKFELSEYRLKSLDRFRSGVIFP